jgi:hypothetical protein
MDMDSYTDSDQLPPDLNESSLLDPTPLAMPAIVHEVEYKIVSETSIRGKDKLFDTLGYSYTVKKRYSASTTWRCSVRNKSMQCPATVREFGGEFSPGLRDHIHPPLPGSDIAASIACIAKEKAQENPHQSAGSIVQDLIRDYLPDDVPCPALQQTDYIARNANNHRQKLRPKDPVDLDFALNDEHIPDNFLRKDIALDNARHVMFASDEQLQLLAKAKTWYMDATFKVIRKPFMQMFSIHAFVRHENSTKQVPLVTCMMSRRSKQDYIAIFREILDFLPSPPQVQRVVLDYEEATWRAIRTVMPNINAQGCAFHFTQAVYRHVQQLGLQQAYQTDDGTFKYIRKLMALCFMPANHIPSLFGQLQGEASTDSLKSLVEYMRKTWITSTVWPPSAWSVYGLSIRTNNDVEGWHNRLNKRGRPHMPFYMLITLLHDEARLVHLQVQLVSESKLKRHQEKKYRDLQKKIFNYWGEYVSGTRSALQLLRACSRLYGPVQ